MTDLPSNPKTFQRHHPLAAVPVLADVPAPRCTQCRKVRPIETVPVWVPSTDAHRRASAALHEQALREKNLARQERLFRRADAMSSMRKEGNVSGQFHLTYQPTGYYSPRWCGHFCTLRCAWQWAETRLAKDLAG